MRSLRTGTVLGELSERWPAARAASPAAATGRRAGAGRAAAAPPRRRRPAAARRASTSCASWRRPHARWRPANILGEGRLEVVLTDGARLSLYRWEEQALAWRWDEEGRGGRRILSLDAADLDGDGRAEVLVTTVVRGRVTSELRRWQDGALQVVGAVDGVYLRAAPRPGAPALLLGQRAGIDEVLAGRVEQYRLRDGAFERVEGSALPAGGRDLRPGARPGGGPVALYALDRDGYISGLTPRRARSLWRSARPYGGYPPPLTARELFGPGAVGRAGLRRGDARLPGPAARRGGPRGRPARRPAEFHRFAGAARAPAQLAGRARS